MTPADVRIEALDGPAAAAVQDDITHVYAEAFAEPPYLKTAADVEANARRLRSQVRKATFRGALARTMAGDPVGIAYGYPLSPTTGWWDRLATPVPDEMRREDGRRTFGLIELAVLPAWRRQGIARALHTIVLRDAPEERVLLNARPDAPAAQAAYCSWGYRRVGSAYPWDGAALHDVMLLTLR
ncbi:Acetyltransferase (GNAT) domain-containing protein [Streptomyces zhaozhouensis]|uniref:Acetyltransferase (GNAT) domain-containing protein n=1 Tax=Streptomyces zhaozhouensis TaxID=1300267 RepID=A0A286E7U9_9ACTN|nr:GNAT family N-acetyltransferase [Streptomyces zhaozhouensis]SOD66961.1 Acetyltransferase (GNAT) domain-containing protein [Streptomyces zhaozhouensis]